MSKDSEVYVNKKVLKKNSECVILKDYDKCYGTFNYYLFSTEGDVILTVTDCNCRQIPTVLTDKFEKFSLEEQHKKEKAEFKAWLKKEGFTE